MDPLPIWLEEWAKLPPTSTPVDVADFVDQRVTKKLAFGPAASMSPPPQFTFQKSIFESALIAIGAVPAIEPLSPAISLATAWQSAVLASTMVISSGTVIVPPPPPSSGVVASLAAVVDPTIALAFTSLVAELAPGIPVGTPLEAKLPTALFNAFSKLSYSMVGTDSTVPPVGPLPILLPLTPVL